MVTLGSVKLEECSGLELGLHWVSCSIPLLELVIREEVTIKRKTRQVWVKEQGR